MKLTLIKWTTIQSSLSIGCTQHHFKFLLRYLLCDLLYFVDAFLFNDLDFLLPGISIDIWWTPWVIIKMLNCLLCSVKSIGLLGRRNGRHAFSSFLLWCLLPERWHIRALCWKSIRFSELILVLREDFNLLILIKSGVLWFRHDCHRTHDSCIFSVKGLILFVFPFLSRWNYRILFSDIVSTLIPA